ncbi:MAG: ADP-ribosylglycohydrolase family protein, partial [Myxococcales bacterium]|nr:ADP-ribosylglycohydrolase family protein [Myxococcales bacterium]
VMRAYPFGLVFADAPERAEAWAVAHSLLTHGDPIAQAACAALARGVAAVVADAPVAEVLTVMVQAADRYSPPTARMIERAVADAHAGTDPDVVFERLQAWAAHEAVAAAAYLFARHPDDLRAALLCGANTSGDSDSIATLGGALVGARVGVQGVPDAWRVNLERSAALDALARRIGQRG